MPLFTHGYGILCKDAAGAKPLDSVDIVATQAQQGSLVSVKMDSLSVVYSLNGVDLGPTFLAGISNMNGTDAGYWQSCGGYVQLNSNIDSAATLIFNGTTISVDLLLWDYAGDTYLYLDGVIWETFHGYSSIQHGCEVQTLSNINLSRQTHNVTVVNATPSNYTYINGFNYTSFVDVSPTSHHSIGTIIGGVIGGVVILLALIFAANFIMKRRRRRAHDAILPGRRGSPGLTTPPEEPMSQDVSTAPYRDSVTTSPVASGMGLASDTLSKSEPSSPVAPTMSHPPSAHQQHPSLSRPLHSPPSPPYSSPVSKRAPTDSIIGRPTSDPSQVDLDHQFVNRGVSRLEMVRTMGEVGSSDSIGGPIDGMVDEQPPTNHGSSERGR
ncbi:hypothetical protein FRB96_002726 [Tulasnella sp. 330]|nr:hypothetical protein FRB96_002726 [Tulasnella sp. 330]